MLLAKDKVFVFPGHMHVAKSPTVISTLLGSCVAVCLFDPISKVGGLNHYLLPEMFTHEDRSGRFGNFAIPALIEMMGKSGADPQRLVAKVYGGANMSVENHFGESIGSSNIVIAYQMLDQFRIPVLGENVGGSLGRKIHMSSSTFEVEHLLNQKVA